jgi:CRP/FNR family cyclic AMP-dependent transcriptional regulator
MAQEGDRNFAQGTRAMNGQALEHPTDKLLARLTALGLPREAITALLDRYTPVRYPKGAPLFAKGSPADVVFAVLSGVVKVNSSRPGADRILVELAGPGDIVGYADFADSGGERSQLFEAHALTNTTVALFTRHHVSEVLKALEPSVLIGLAEAINTLWSTVAYRYATFLGMSLRQRLEVVLNELAMRFGVADARGTLLTPELAQEELAEMIGSSRPMVSKLLMEMTQQGILARDGRRRILVTPPKANLLPPQPLFQSSVTRNADGPQPAPRAPRDSGRKTAVG